MFLKMDQKGELKLDSGTVGIQDLPRYHFHYSVNGFLILYVKLTLFATYRFVGYELLAPSNLCNFFPYHLITECF